MSTNGDPATDEQIRAVVARLSRPHRSGGRVIERAAIMAEGADSAAILAWIAAGDWTPEEPVALSATSRGSGVHGMGRNADAVRSRAPRRYISPPGDDA